MIFTLQKAPPTGEVAQLQRLQAAGVPVVPTVVLQGLETEFYQLGNLAENLQKAFAGVFGARLDEAKLEAACSYSEKLMRETYLLPERAAEVVKALPSGQLLVRYAGEAPFAVCNTQQEALWALKRLWASRWQLDAVLQRQPSLAPPETPTLLQRAGQGLVLDSQSQPPRWLSQGAVVRVG